MDINIHIPEPEIHQALAVRPDVLVTAVSARLEDVAPSQAVTILKHTATKLQTRLLEVHSRSELSARKLDLGRMHADKSGKMAISDAQLDGVVFVPLDDKLDYWARAELVAKITESLRVLTTELYKAKPCVRFGFRAPTPRVRDVTAHKIELTKRFSTQWQALTGNGEKSPSPKSWDLPEKVAQHAVSLEEVRLTLVPARKSSSSRES